MSIMQAIKQLRPEAKSAENHWPKAKNTYTITSTHKQQHETHNSSFLI